MNEPEHIKQLEGRIAELEYQLAVIEHRPFIVGVIDMNGIAFPDQPCTCKTSIPCALHQDRRKEMIQWENE